MQHRAYRDGRLCGYGYGTRCQPPLRRPRRCAHHLYGAHRAGGRVCRMAGPLRHPSGRRSPRLYLSVTEDNRILIGGLDSAFMDEKGRVAGLLDMTPAVEKRFDLVGVYPAGYVPRHSQYHGRVCVCGQGRHDQRPVARDRPPARLQPDRLRDVLRGQRILYAEAAGRLLLQQYQGIDDHELGLFSPHRGVARQTLKRKKACHPPCYAVYYSYSMIRGVPHAYSRLISCIPPHRKRHSWLVWAAPLRELSRAAARQSARHPIYG